MNNKTRFISTLLRAYSEYRLKFYKNDSLQRKSCPIARASGFCYQASDFFLNLPDGQVLFLGEIQITEGL